MRCGGGGWHHAIPSPCTHTCPCGQVAGLSEALLPYFCHGFCQWQKWQKSQDQLCRVPHTCNGQWMCWGGLGSLAWCATCLVTSCVGVLASSWHEVVTTTQVHPYLSKSGHPWFGRLVPMSAVSCQDAGVSRTWRRRLIIITGHQH